jgi:dTDP-4-dehydrorhamnose 3,5-epimerase
MKVSETALPGVLLLEPKVYGDSRGFFLETYRRTHYQEAGIQRDFVQDNISRSGRGVLRGLHFQLEKPQAKLVSVIRGAVFDVAVDVRHGSPTFGQWVGFELSDQNHRQLFIPEGFAHGFEVLSEEADFFYKCSDYYHPTSEFGVCWNDATINIPWHTKQPIISAKDSAYPSLMELSAQQLPRYQR